MPLAPPWTLTTAEWLDHIYIDMSRRRDHAQRNHRRPLRHHRRLRDREHVRLPPEFGEIREARAHTLHVGCVHRRKIR
jgi:hypothetical protein